MRRILVALLLTLSVVGVSAVPASTRGGSHLHFKSGHHFRSFRHGFTSGPHLHHRHHFRHGFPRLHHRHPFGHFRASRHPHSIIFFPTVVIPSPACDPVRISGRWVRIGGEWVWVTEHWGCR